MNQDQHAQQRPTRDNDRSLPRESASHPPRKVLAPIRDSSPFPKKHERESFADGEGPIRSELTEAKLQRALNVDTWSKICKGEVVEIQDEALRFERQLASALKSTDHLGVPNAFRTAICFDVLLKISSKFERFQQLMRIIHREAESAIYLPSSTMSSVAAATVATTTIEGTFARKTYFTELKQVLAEKEALERDVIHLDDLYAFMKKQLRTNEQMVDRLAQRWARVMMKQTLLDWKKIIIRKKYTRVLLEKTSDRWSKQRLLRLFRRWAAFAGAEKIRRTRLQLTHFQENQHDFQDLLVKLEQQIESAKQETRVNREHVDFAKRQLLGLEDLLHQLDLHVRQSNERKLQSIVNQWGELCFALVDCELLYLQNMLDAVSVAQYVDVTVLAMKGEELGELLHLPSDVLVLRWINFQLSQCPTFKYYNPSPSGFIQNFTSDMRSHYVLRHILQRILTVNAKDPSLRRMSTFVSRCEGGTAPDPVNLKLPAPFPKREELRAALCERLEPGCPAFLGDQVLDCEATGDLAFCLFGFLICEHPSLNVVFPRNSQSNNSSSFLPHHPTPPGTSASGGNRSSLDPICPWQDAQTALNDARTIWESVRSQWTELQTPFEIQENTKTTPDLTSPPQLLLRANGALQNAVNMVQYACSKRAAVMKVWGCVQRKVQQDALRLLVRRGRKEIPMVLMDRRVWREKYMLTTLHIAKLTTQFAPSQDKEKESEALRHHYEHKLPAGREALEAELVDVEPVLEEHYESLRRVYRYYAAMEPSQDLPSGGSGGNNSSTQFDSTGAKNQHPEDEEERFFQKIAMSMSLSEFHAFLKDCRFFGAIRPFPYEFIQRVFAQVNVEVAADTDAAVLAAPGGQSSALSALSSEDHSTGTSDNNASEMTPAEFVEALLHIVRSKYICLKPSQPVHKPTAGSLSSSSSWTLAQRMRKCIEKIILPHAMQERERVNVFRPQLLTAECREVFAKHQKKLAALYARFANTAAADESPGPQELNASKLPQPQSQPQAASPRKMLSVAGLVALCRHFELLREHFLNLDDVQHVLAAILQLERESIAIHGHQLSNSNGNSAMVGGLESGGGAGGGGSGAIATPAPTPTSSPSDYQQRAHESEEQLFLTYAEFVEALAAIACYLRPDAFVPLATKLDEFCLQQLHFGFTA